MTVEILPCPMCGSSALLDATGTIEVGYGGYWLCPSCASELKHKQEMETQRLDRLEFYAHHFRRMMIPVEGDHPVVRRKKLMELNRFQRDWRKREEELFLLRLKDSRGEQ